MVSSSSFEWMLVEEFPTSSIWPRPWHCSASLCVDHYVMTFPGRYLCSYICSSKDCCGFWCILQLACLCPWLENKIFFKWVDHCFDIWRIYRCLKTNLYFRWVASRGQRGVAATSWGFTLSWRRWDRQYNMRYRGNLMEPPNRATKFSDPSSVVLNIKYHVIITMEEPSMWIWLKLHFGGWDCFTA